jgi:predicted membrane protein
MLWELLVPAIIVILGLKLVLSGLLGNKANEMLKQLRLEGKDLKAGTAVFSGCDMNYDGQVFEGAELNAIFGAVSCDLRNAVIQKDCAIQVSAIFGGIDILVPAGVNVRANATSIFGGVSNKTAVQPNAPTIYISGTCMFGGVEIK